MLSDRANCVIFKPIQGNSCCIQILRVHDEGWRLEREVLG